MLSYKEGQVASMSYSYQFLLSEATFLLFEAEKLVFLIPLDAGVPGVCVGGGGVGAGAGVQVPEGP